MNSNKPDWFYFFCLQKDNDAYKCAHICVSNRKKIVCQIGRKLSTGCNFAKRNGWMPPYIVFFHSISENIIQEYLWTEWKREQQKLKWGGWKEGGDTRASGAIQRALTFINVDRNLLAEKCCAITTAASRAEKNWGWKHGHTVWLCPWQVMFSMNNL